MNRRTAHSLVELLLAMSACTAILTLSAALIHRVLFVHSRTQAIVGGERAALRLSEHFRHDVHAAESAQKGELNGGEGLVLRLELAGGRSIEYRRAEGTVLRVLLEGEAVRGREEFDFPGQIELAIRDESPGLVTLSVKSPPPDSPKEAGRQAPVASPGPLCLEATARLNRYSEIAEAPEETEL
jgi:hypothetical protein